MYNEEESAKPYARALVEAAIETKTMAQIRGDIETLASQWETCSELREWCKQIHSLPRAAHKASVDELWSKSFTTPVLIMLEALAEAGLLAAIPHVITSFRRLADIALSRKDVTFVFAVTPDPALVKQLSDQAMQSYGPDTTITVQVDASLGAGLIVRAGDMQIDGSLQGRLRRLRAAFVTVK